MDDQEVYCYCVEFSVAFAVTIWYMGDFVVSVVSGRDSAADRRTSLKWSLTWASAIGSMMVLKVTY